MFKNIKILYLRRSEIWTFEIEALRKSEIWIQNIYKFQHFRFKALGEIQILIWSVRKCRVLKLRSVESKRLKIENVVIQSAEYFAKSNSKRPRIRKVEIKAKPQKILIRSVRKFANFNSSRRKRLKIPTNVARILRIPSYIYQKWFLQRFQIRASCRQSRRAASSSNLQIRTDQVIRTNFKLLGVIKQLSRLCYANGEDLASAAIQSFRGDVVNSRDSSQTTGACISDRISQK